MNIEIGKKALLTLDNWFYAPDGISYHAVFGTIKAVKTTETTLGIKPNSRSVNWYVEIGNMLIAGCQIHFAVRCEEFNSGPAKGWEHTPEKGLLIYDRPCSIYDADRGSV